VEGGSVGPFDNVVMMVTMVTGFYLLSPGNENTTDDLDYAFLRGGG
jgi:hypothetical protein